MLPELHSILNLLEGGFGQLKVLVIGDIMLDRYIHGDVERISPEAPVPVLRHARRYERAGGAANVAMNLAGLGCQTFLGGFWGSDAEQSELAAILKHAGIDTVGTVCPNLGELAAATGIPSHHTEDLLAAGQALVAEHDFKFLTVTMSEKGISVLRPASAGNTGIYHSPARAREVFDVSGAGDTVIATLAASLAGGLQIETAVELANLAAGIVVSKVGTVPIAAHELVAALTPSSGLTAGEKILDLDRIKLRVAEWPASGETIVFTNACFDLLHVGHITLLEDCRRFGSKLVLGLNADASVCRLKGPTRPIVSERERARVMAALAADDSVVLFEEDTPLVLVRALKL